MYHKDFRKHETQEHTTKQLDAVGRFSTVS